MDKYLCFRIRLNEQGCIGDVEDYPSKKRTEKFTCIYAFTYESEIIRVGEGEQGYSRVRSGLNQSLTKPVSNGKRGKRNYYAYKWREKYKEKYLHLIMFKISTPNQFEDYEAQKWRRAVEAEITYELRQINESWPKEMNEIHFDEDYRVLESVQSEVDSFFSYFRLIRANKAAPADARSARDG